VGAALAALAVAAVARASSLALHAYVDDPLYRFVRKVSDRVVKAPFVVEHFGLLMTLGVVAGSALLVGVAWGVGGRLTGRARLAASAMAAAAGCAAVGVYAFDSRVYYGRYELSMHIPAELTLLAIAFVAGAAVLAASGAARSRYATAAFAVVAALAVLATGVAIARFDADATLKTLVWRRGVLGRRAFQVVAWLGDHDRDGASGWLGGGDGDDRNPGVNPLATEIPSNGIDDNCIGGDLTAPARSPATESAAAAPGVARNFVFISIDTLRADRMSAYGYGRPTSPRLAELGAAGRVFERAYSQGTNTGVSFASLQRSATRGAVFDRDRPTLFGRLAQAGFATTFVNARRDDAWLETRRWQDYRQVILDGVESIDHVAGDELWDGDRVTDRAIEVLSSLPAEGRHATWVHYLDPHEPRRKMAPYDFGDSASDLYDTEVAFSDREVGRLLDWLRESGRMRDTLVVLVADHGESFLDHGHDLHGNRPYDEQIRVPLMMWAPDVAPARVATPVGLWDVAPSVLAYFGLPGIPGAEGRDVLRAEPALRPIFSETPRNLVEATFYAYAVTDGEWRYLYDVRGNTVELYHLTEDPLELVNLADRRPEKAAELRAILARWLDSTVSVRPRRDA
jgi:arylsulfatase A-like enzyme